MSFENQSSRYNKSGPAAAATLRAGLAVMELAQANGAHLIYTPRHQDLGQVVPPHLELLLPYDDADITSQTAVNGVYEAIRVTYASTVTSDDEPKRLITPDKQRVGYGVTIEQGKTDIAPASTTFTVLGDPQFSPNVYTNTSYAQRCARSFTGDLETIIGQSLVGDMALHLDPQTPTAEIHWMGSNPATEQQTLDAIREHGGVSKEDIPVLYISDLNGLAVDFRQELRRS